MIKAVLNFDDGKVGIHTAGVEKVAETFDPGFYTAQTIDGKLDIRKTALMEVHPPYYDEMVLSINRYIDKFFNTKYRKQVNGMGFRS